VHLMVAATNRGDGWMAGAKYGPKLRLVAPPGPEQFSAKQTQPAAPMWQSLLSRAVALHRV